MSVTGVTSSGVVVLEPCTATVDQAYLEAGSATLGAVSPACITRYQTAWCAEVDPALVKSPTAFVHPAGAVVLADPATVTCEYRKTVSPGCQPAGSDVVYEPAAVSSPAPLADDRTDNVVAGGGGAVVVVGGGAVVVVVGGGVGVAVAVAVGVAVGVGEGAAARVMVNLSA